MKSNLFVYILLLVLVIFSSCSSSSKIGNTDGSPLSSSKTALLEKIDSVYRYRFSRINSYSNKATIEVNFDGSSHKLVGRVNAVTDKSIKASISLPFPPLTVGSLELTPSSVSVTSSYADINIDKSVPDFLLSVANAALYGTMPLNIIDKHFKLNYISIKNSRYHLTYSGPNSTVVIFQIDSQYRIAQVSVASHDFNCELFSSDFELIDNHHLPSSIKVVLLSPKMSGGVTVKSSSIKID